MGVRMSVRMCRPVAAETLVARQQPREVVHGRDEDCTQAGDETVIHPLSTCRELSTT